MKLPQLISIIQAVRLELLLGHSVLMASQRISQQSASDLGKNLVDALEVWGKSNNTEWSKTEKRKTVLSILKSGLLGAPIEGALRQVEEEFLMQYEQKIEKQLQLIPLQLIFPLTLLILPAFMLILIAPFLTLVTL
jgi:hypothetical protein